MPMLSAAALLKVTQCTRTVTVICDSNENCVVNIQGFLSLELICDCGSLKAQDQII